MQPKLQPDQQPVQYFVPGQVVLLAQHPAGVDPKEIATLIRRNGSIAENSIISKGEIDPARIQTFQQGDQRAFSLVFVDVVRQVNRPRPLIRVLDDLNQRIIREQGRAVGADLVIEVASPNWLSSATPGQIGTGGPGARPVVAELPPGGWQHRSVGTTGAPFGFKLPLPLATQVTNKTSVTVAVIDTAPSQALLKQAFDTWHTEHPLIQSLLGPDGMPGAARRLHVTYGDPTLMAAVDDYGLRDHTYNMADHGLFAAGIIHTLAPQAELHLIEVLNHYGVGTLETIANGLRLAPTIKRRGGLVVNCSLMLNLPLPGHPKPNLNWPALGSDRELLTRLGWPLEWICDALLRQDVLVVAAAGNDGGRRGRPQARYPAAFGSVVGVGALHNDGTPAPYSNLSDRPLRGGIATFGGKASVGKALPGEAVLGVYTGALPDDRPGATLPNKTGWAWWAGTSFATPTITGVVADLIGQGQSPTQAVQTVRDAQATTTAVGEEIFLVKQGT